MSAVSTPAIVLSALRYGETSKIVRLATRDHGVQSAIAKGALRPKSRFGASLQVLSNGQAQLLLSERRELHILTAFDFPAVPVALTREVGRYATATVLAEIMLHFAPAEPHPESFEVLKEGLARLAAAPGDLLPATAVQEVWQLVGSLGFAPALEDCVRCGRTMPEAGPLAFSAPDGGALCGACAGGIEHTILPPEARAALVHLLVPGDTLPRLDRKNAAAHRRLVARYIRYHMGEGARLPALEFWLAQAWGGAAGNAG